LRAKKDVISRNLLDIRSTEKSNENTIKIRKLKAFVNRGCPVAKFILGQLYIDSNGCYKMGIELLTESAEQGFEEAQGCLG
jgi:hypothetical protein